MKRPARVSSQLSESLCRHLNAYSLAASAAGMLALAQPAEAKIVYTSAHKNFTQYPPVILDLNHDGIGDFVLALGGRDESGEFVSQYAFAYAPRSNNTNEIVATSARGYAQAVALRGGERIGPGRLFGGVDILVAHTTQFGKGSSSTHWMDQWANGGKGLKDRYLGLKFNIKGKVHFGWARITVTTSGKTFTTTLTGYAYETIPNKAITAGETNESDDDQPAPASLKTHAGEARTLGALALGAPGLSIWTREESVAATPEGD